MELIFIVAVLAMAFWRPSILLLLLSVATVVVHLRYRKRARPQVDLDSRASTVLNELKFGHAPDYVLFLRPFAADPVRPERLHKPTWRIGILFDAIVDPELSLNEVIRQAASRVTDSIVALQGRRPSRVGDINCPDEDWRQLFSLAADNARLIVALSGSSDGIDFELQQLMANQELLRKTVFVMPPTSEEPMARVYQAHCVHVRDIAFVVELFRLHGLQPPPAVGGQIVTYHSRADAPQVARWKWSERALARLFQDAVKGIDAPERPLTGVDPQG